MSLAKVTYVGAARKDQGECERCHTALPAGSAYRWFTVGFRSTLKHRRCLDPACDPSRAERESSKIADVYAAIDTAEFDLAEDSDALSELLNDIASTIREVAGEYREASVDPATGNVFNPDAEERASILDSAAEELEGWSPSTDVPDPCAEHDADSPEDLRAACEDCAADANALDELREEASKAANDVELP